MYRILLIPHDIDTRELRQALWAHRIGHRFTNEEDGQVLWLADPGQQGAVEELLGRWQRGEALTPPPQAQAGTSLDWQRVLRHLPVTVLTLVLSLVVFGAQALWGDMALIWMTIVPVGISGGALAVGTLADSMASGQVWRLISPIFLHFGWMHLIFNMMWLWYFGRQIELLNGPLRMFTLVIVAGVASNLAQYATGSVFFGGMSGVDYALLGYVWLMMRRAPQSGFFVPQMLVVFMLLWMVFTMTGFAGLVGFGNVANAAHLGGLLVGLALGWYHSRKPAI
ncbi:rhomboid family intramembrane serine protease [Halomonas binhaiensis]|uniref:Rhomboid family intramembrane serine protease n=1 Tax=Halomonas binhaiensis TaxID=2562282 RepID=A0A5C1NKI3_9GAMM|nr:rhomboid family intramembrane serine protease [Halomonas binhaiensis]QEM82329.1 rhomboid family intramembrane serine protease [Halomonas binhaiensis]